MKKCKLLQRKTEFLGQEIENGQVRSSPSKTKAVKQFKEPSNVKEIQRSWPTWFFPKVHRKLCNDC